MDVSMAAFTNEMHMDSPCTLVFDLVADARNELQWHDGVSRVELLTDEPIGTGAKFIVEDQRGVHDAAITRYEPPERVDFTVKSKQLSLDIKYAFTETDGSTTVVVEYDVRPKGTMKALLPVIMPVIKRDVAEQNATFKEHCESQTS